MDEIGHRAGHGQYRPLNQVETEKSKTLNLLLAAELLKIYGTEKLQLNYFSKLIALASNTLIVDVLEEQMEDTQHHVRRLEKICAQLQLSIPGKVSSLNAITQLMMKEGIKLANSVKSSPNNSDRVIIHEIQKISHYKMANYMNLSAWAKSLQLGDICELLEDNLDDIINADLSLSEISESGIYSDLT